MEVCDTKLRNQHQKIRSSPRSVIDELQFIQMEDDDSGLEEADIDDVQLLEEAVKFEDYGLNDRQLSSCIT